jgi:hypothetical protein
MPGIIPHLVAGASLFLIGEFYFHYKSQKAHFLSDHVLLLGVTLFFSLFPDFPLGIYYMFHVFTPELLMSYHQLLHAIVTPLSLVGLLIIIYMVKTKREPIYVMGLIAILVHIMMDAYIHEGGFWF